MTPAAKKFVTPLTFFSLSQHPVFADLWGDEADWSRHVHLAEWADVFVIAPCTVNTLARLAQGRCEDPVSALYLSMRAPTLVAPAMDLEMWKHPATQANLKVLRERGVQILEPGKGYLASGLQGQGRLAEPAAMAQAVMDSWIAQQQKSPWRGRKVMITAGPTREPLDPVRYITNRSSGAMGVALAETARRLGAEVTLLYGPMETPVPSGVRAEPFETADELFALVQQFSPESDVMLFAAAVSDYALETPLEHKHKKTDNWQLDLVNTPDSLAWAGRHRRERQVICGFALETQNALENARAKLARKQADALVLNNPLEPGAGFGPGTNKVTLLDRFGRTQEGDSKPKPEIALDIFNFLEALLPQ